MNRTELRFQTVRPPSRLLRILRDGLVVLVLLPVFVVLGFWVSASQREAGTAEQLAPASGRLVETRGGRFFVQEAGPKDAPPVILVHGPGAWSELWRPTIERLGDRGHRVIAIDLPPFGYSDRGSDNGNRRSALADRLTALLEAMELDRVTIVAHSFGAAPVVETAMRHPGRIAGLVLVSGMLGIVDEGAPAAASPWLDRLLDTPLLREPIIASTLTNPLVTEALLRHLAAKPDAIDARVVGLLQAPMRLHDTTAALGRWLRDFRAGDPEALSGRRENYARVTVPTRLVWGEKDAIAPLAQAHELMKLIGGAKLTVLPGVGHLPQLEDAAAFHRALDVALTELGSVPMSEAQ